MYQLTCKEAGSEDDVPDPVSATNLTVELAGHIASNSWQEVKQEVDKQEVDKQEVVNNTF